MRHLRVGTRGSKLALWQTERVIAAVRAKHPQASLEAVVIRVESDRQPSVPITAMESRGVFTRDIEVALLSGKIDLAVHSLKDLPSEDAPGLVLAATLARDDPSDAVVTQEGAGLDELCAGAVVGTSSLRRTALVREARPDLEVRPLRGNIDTRLHKLMAGEYDAIIMATAALRRLARADVPTRPLPVETWIPAVAQGIIGVQARSDDREVLNLLGSASEPESMLLASVERSFLRSLSGGCSVPVGGHATLSDGAVTLRGLVGSPDGLRMLRSARTASVEDAYALGARVAGELMAAGGSEILDELRATVPIVRAP